MDYLDPEEEFEMMHADEIEMMNEMNYENDGNIKDQFIICTIANRVKVLFLLNYCSFGFNWF